MYQRLLHNFDMIQYLVKNASPVQLSWREEEAGWSLGDILGHLGKVEKMHACFNLPDPTCRRGGPVACGKPAGNGGPEIGLRAFTEYARYRRETLARLQHASPAQWRQRLASGEGTGPINLVDFIERVDAHDQLHIQQMERIVGRMPLNPLLARALQEIDEYHRRYQAHLAGAGSVLDIGVGPGLALRHIIRHNPHLACAGVDIRDLRLPGVEVPLQVYDGHTLPYAADQFDVSLLFYVLHHCQDPHRLLAEAARVTHHKLLLIEEFSQPGIDPVSLDLTERQSHRALGMPSDLPYQLFDKAELAAMLQASRLKLVEHYPLPSQTSRPVVKYLYVLAKEPE